MAKKKPTKPKPAQQRRDPAKSPNSKTSPRPRKRRRSTEDPAPAVSRPSLTKSITIRGARTHNLKNITCEIPRGHLTVVTGVSGSGKSSLAFDTLFAEGQRRYVESLSTYARQFLDRMPRPDVDEIDHIPPAIALEQKNAVKNARSTIGTATEINDYLRLLYAKIGRIFCPDCQEEVRRDSPQSAPHLAEAAGWMTGNRVYVLAPQHLEEPNRFPAVVDEMRRQGFTRLWIHNELVDTTDPQTSLPKRLKEFAVVADRLVLRGEDDRARLVAAVEAAFQIAKGLARLRRPEGDEIQLHEGLVCRSCGRTFHPPEPLLFSFYSPLGACKTCQGFGRIIGLDMTRVIPNPALTLEEGLVAPWNTPTNREMYDWLATFDDLDLPWDVPFEKMTARQKRTLIEGKGEWVGIKGFFRWLEQKRYKVQNRILLARYRGFTPCPDCDGTRLVPEARWVRVSSQTIAELWTRSVRQLREWFQHEIQLSPVEEKTSELILKEIRSRLDYLDEVGLGYLTLDRQTRTLSGGESQRINLATALGSALTETLYVLDEPTVGLHPRDTDRLIRILKRLVELNNTVVVVEHDLDVIRSAGRLVDLGPRAGENGGEVVYQGEPDKLVRSANGNSLTARYLKPLFEKPAPHPLRRKPKTWISVLDACEHNLRHITVDIPLHTLTCVTGVSGSGKTTLIQRCLYGNYRRFFGDPDVESGQILRLEGTDALDDMIFVDQSPIGRSARSNPATYLKAWDPIRALFAETREARRRGLRPRDFSFNVEGGRCEECQGTGTQTIDMQFLADVTVPCAKCDGRRFQDRILDVTYEGFNVTQVLDLTVTEAIRLYADQPRVTRGLVPLADVGLGYLRLGQSTATLSGGEAQRLKLASHLAQAKQRNNILLLFDEPTTGLHPADLDVLLGVFDRLLDEGFSILVIEHNLELIAHADWIIDLGPEGGDEGGDVVVTGTPESIALHKTSHTARFLRSRLTPAQSKA